MERYGARPAPEHARAAQGAVPDGDEAAPPILMMKRKAVLEFLATLSHKDLMIIVAEAEQLRVTTTAPTAASLDDSCTTCSSAPSPICRRGRSSSAAERNEKLQQQSRAALAAAVAKKSVPGTTLFAECRLPSGECCSAIRLRATHVLDADLFKAASNAILGDLGRRNPGWADKVKSTAQHIVLLVDGEAKSTAVFSQRANANDIIVHLMATATKCQRQGYGTILLKILQAYINKHAIYVEVSGSEVPVWWHKKKFVRTRDNVKPKAWQQSKLMCWSQKCEELQVKLHISRIDAVVSNQSLSTAAGSVSIDVKGVESVLSTNANVSARSRSSVTTFQSDSANSTSSLNSATSSSSCQACKTLENGFTLSSLATPVALPSSGKKPTAGGRAQGDSHCSSRRRLQPAREDRENSPDFFDSWADMETLVGQKTREFIGIHIAKENETPLVIAKQYSINPPELILQQNADWYPQLSLRSRLKASTKLMYATTETGGVLEGTVLGMVDEDGYTSPFWRVQYSLTSATNMYNGNLRQMNHHEKTDRDGGGGRKSSGGEDQNFVLERSLEEVWAGCWAFEAHRDGWILSGNPYIGAAVAKAVDNETHKEVNTQDQNKCPENNDPMNCSCRGINRSVGDHVTGCRSWQWVTGRVVGFGGEDAENLDEHGDKVWRVHYDDFDSEDLNELQLKQAMRAANIHATAQRRQSGPATLCSGSSSSRKRDTAHEMDTTEHQRKRRCPVEHDRDEAEVHLDSQAVSK